MEADPRDGGEDGKKSWVGMKIARHDAMALFVVDFDIFMFLFTRCGSVIIGDQKRAWKKR